MRITTSWARPLRFAIAGISNTLLTWLLYILLLKIFPYPVSYTLSYMAGIGVAYLLLRFFVFGRSAINNGFLWVSLIYLFQYLLGILVVLLWAEVIGGMVEFAPIVSLLVSYPLIYTATKVIFKSD